MKRSIIIGVLSSIMFSGLISAQERLIKASEAPKDIIAYLNAHFPKVKIVSIEEEIKKSGNKYEVKLENQVELDFNHKSQLIDIESKSKAELPSSVVPPKLWKYARQNYPDQKIIGYEKKSNKLKVELDNGWDIEFSTAGKFLRVDK